MCLRALLVWVEHSALFESYDNSPMTMNLIFMLMMKDDRWKMKDERWKMKDEKWKMKDERWK